MSGSVFPFVVILISTEINVSKTHDVEKQILSHRMNDYKSSSHLLLKQFVCNTLSLTVISSFLHFNTSISFHFYMQILPFLALRLSQV